MGQLRGTRDLSSKRSCREVFSAGLAMDQRASCHYALRIGGFQGLDELSFITVITTVKKDMEVLKQIEGTELAYRSGKCVEDGLRSIYLVFSLDTISIKSLRERAPEAFSVHVRNMGVAVNKAVLCEISSEIKSRAPSKRA